MREAGENYMLKFLCLRGDGGGDARISVSVEIYPPGRNGVENAAPVGGVEPDAFGARSAQWRWIQRKVCKGMPDAEWRSHGLARLLRKRRAIKMVQENLHERGAVQVGQAR